MAAVNANIVVEQTNLAINPTTNSIGVTVDPINLGVFAGGVSNVTPGGTSGQLQYNLANTTFGGVANTSVASNGTVTFQNLANLKVDGGVNGYFLQTDGTGVLTWNAGTTTPGSANPGGANTQIQYNDAGGFGGQAGFTFDEVTGNVAMPASLTVAANVTAGTFFGDGGNLTGLDSTKIVNGTSNVEIATVNGNVDFTVGSANVARMSTTGAAYPGVLAVNGNITAKNDITVEAGANLVGSGNFTDITVSGTTTIQQAKEKVVQNATAATGTVNYDLLTSAIVLQTTDALANFTLNIRGNASTTLDSVMSTDESMTLSFINQNGATAYNPTVFQIDGTTQSVSYSGAGIGIPTPNGNDIFTYNIIKTAGSTFTVFGSRVGYL